MAQRLTDKTELVDKPSDGAWIHVVEPTDTTAHPQGTSRKQNPKNFLKGLSLVPVLGALVYKKGSNQSTTQIEADDWVIYMDDERLVMGIAIANMTALPADLDDANKLKKFYDGSPLLP